MLRGTFMRCTLLDDVKASSGQAAMEQSPEESAKDCG